MESIYITTSRCRYVLGLPQYTITSLCVTNLLILQCRLHALRNTNHAPWKPLLLFLHGFPENSYSWRNQLKYFRDTHTVVALDMRGFGDSDAPRSTSDYSMDSLCLDVVATVRACGYETCVLIGHDWGGMVAWNVSANFPKMITGLVTVCSPHPRAYSEKECFTLAQAARSSYFMLFDTPWLPEIYLRHSQGKEIRKMMLLPPMGVVTPQSLTEQDVEFYVSALLRPYRLTAGLNYYRNAMFTSSKRALNFVTRYADYHMQCHLNTQ
jgi:epoxide hydrolase 4